MARKSYLYGSLLLLILLPLVLLLYETEPLLAQQSAGEIRITEFMASNDTILADEDGAFSDWLEVHNGQATELDLTGWYLTDDATNLTKWQFPTTTLASDGFLVIFASSKNRVIAGSQLHTNFKLGSAGEYLALVQPDGVTVASEYSPQYPQQWADISYGLDESGNAHYFTTSTPGSVNGSSATLGPTIEQASHTPAQPMSNEDLMITATMTSSLSSVMSPTLHYRVMYSDILTVTMRDDGTQGDGAANDGVYGAMIPQSAYQAGEMVRYYLTAEDAKGRVSRWPLFQSATNSAEYLGTMVNDATVTSQLPILYWFVQDMVAAQTREGTRASLFYDGRFYDNVFVRERGISSTEWPKISYKFDFNQGDHFVVSAAQEAVEELNLNTTYSDKAYIRQALAFESYRDSGSAYSLSFPMRVQQNGEFHSVAIFVEQLDERYLRRHGLDDEGALYKMYNVLDSATVDVEKKTRLTEDSSDLQALIDGISQPAPQRVTYLYDHVNIAAMINYLATAVIIHDIDIGNKNYYLYRETNNSGEWRFLPWDKDLTFGRNWVDGALLNDTIWADNDQESSYPITINWNALVDLIIDDFENNPVMREMYLRRLRTLMDQLLQAPTTAADQLRYEKRLEAYFTQLEADVALDAAKWPVEWGSPQTLREAIDVIKNDYLAVRRVHLYNTHGPTSAGIIPDGQGTSTVNFGTIEHNPASGNQEEEYFTLVNPNPYAIDISGWKVTNDVRLIFQPGVVIPANGTLYVSPNRLAFRSRATTPTGGEGHFVQGDYTGKLSDVAGALALYNAEGSLMAQTTFGGSSALAGKLIISELNYHPPAEGATDGDEFEFVELQNVSTDTLDLSGITFSDGISYTLPVSTTLAPQQILLLVQNESAFATRYADHNVTIGGIYSKKFSNDGESVSLSDQNGDLITSFEYNDQLPWPESADGEGHTLVRKTPPGDANDASNWQASTNLYGSPCKAEPPDETNYCLLGGQRIYLPLIIGE